VSDNSAKLLGALLQPSYTVKSLSIRQKTTATCSPKVRMIITTIIIITRQYRSRGLNLKL